MKIRKLHVQNVAGYQSLIWEGIQPDLNFLLGRNGTGKSTILQAISCALQFKAGVRSEDLLTRTYPDGEIHIEMSPGPVRWQLRFADILTSQTAPKSEYAFHILESVENRQPKNRVGKLHNDPRQHAMYRYTNALSTLKFFLSSKTESEKQLAREVFDICKGMPAFGASEQWDWIEQALKQRGPLRARPTSCGQYDMLAFVLDLCRLRQSLTGSKDSGFVILDNPETYLHPSCQEPIVNLVQQMIPQAQLFIASHSLKLLCRREPKHVFWLRRENVDQAGTVKVISIRDIDDGGKTAFFDLYGDDVSSAVLGLVRTFESPEYYKFLWECALPSIEVARQEPTRDRQIEAICQQLLPRPSQWTILDYGAGHGDLLVGLAATGRTDLKTTYIAYSQRPSSYLRTRVQGAIVEGSISPESRIIQDMAEITVGCDAIVLSNVCHEILLPELPSLIGRLIVHYLAKTDSSKIIIHEVETLAAGERDFIMWTPDDYQSVLASIPGVRIQTRRTSSPGRLPLDTTVISCVSQQVSFSDIEDRLIKAFDDYLRVKKNKCLNEIEIGLGRDAETSEELYNVIKQRRHAFLVSQLATICLLERRSQKNVGGKLSGSDFCESTISNDS